MYEWFFSFCLSRGSCKRGTSKKMKEDGILNKIKILAIDEAHCVAEW